jgi:hypothetical protein
MKTKHIEIKNWKGCAAASFDLTPGLHLICGNNEAGKSSVLEAIAYTATGATLTPKQRQNRVRAGGKTEVTISEDDEHRVRYTLPANKRVTEGWDHTVSQIAAGIIDVCTLKPKERQEVLSRHLKAEPTAEDIYKWLKPHGYTLAECQEVYNEIQKGGPTGWAKRLTAAEDKGKRLKGQWQEAAAPFESLSFGSDQSNGWLPTGWETELESASEETLAKLVTDAKDNLESKIASRAVNTDELAKLHETWLGKDITIQELAAAEAEQAEADRLYEEKRAEYAALPKPEPKGAPDKLYNCPHCNGLMVLAGSRFIAPQDKQEQPEEEVAALNAALTACRAEGEAAKAKLTAVQQEVGRLKAKLRQEETAHNAWIELAKKQGGSSEEEIDEAREAVRLAEHRLKAFKAWSRTRSLYAEVMQNQHLINCLKPEGVTLDKLRAAIKDFNAKVLKPVCEIADWGIVELHEDMEISYDGKDIEPLCESEQFRAKLTFQAAIAKLDGSWVILGDRVEMFDDERREQIATLFETLDIPGVFARVLSDKEDAPDLAAAGLGCTYWIERGRLAPLGGE